MATDRKKIVTASKPTAKSVSCLGPPPLLKGENPKHYQELLAGITAQVAPDDFIEEIWINDCVQEFWAIARWRRLKAAELNNGMIDALAKILSSKVPVFRAKPLAEGLQARPLMSNAWRICWRPWG